MLLSNYQITTPIRVVDYSICQDLNNNTVLIADRGTVIYEIPATKLLDEEDLLRIAKPYIDKPGAEFEYIWI